MADEIPRTSCSRCRALEASRMANEIPRRARVDLFSPAETAIYAAQRAVEAMPADVGLTEAGMLLAKARDKVADFIDRDIPGHSAEECPAAHMPDSLTCRFHPATGVKA